MGDREGPSSSSSQGSDKGERNARSSAQPMPTGSSYYASEPIQFRVRGSTITGASPPKFVTLEDIMKAAHGMQNMALAHEIAVDQDFKLEPFEPPDNRLMVDDNGGCRTPITPQNPTHPKLLIPKMPVTPLVFQVTMGDADCLPSSDPSAHLPAYAINKMLCYQKLVKETMHKAYFDILREQLNSDPPEYKQALVLLEDVKQGLFSILLPRHTRIREMIEEVLDAEFIQQQAENNSLDFHKYASFVIDLMAKLAAPARDEMIQNITKLSDTVDVFRAILETLEILKLDLANTLIAMIRPHVQQESVQYERAKFDEMLKVSEDGLQHTKEWLKRHIDLEGLTLPVTDKVIIRNVTAQTLAKAYLELLEWDSSKSYPEQLRDYKIDQPFAVHHWSLALDYGKPLLCKEGFTIICCTWQASWAAMDLAGCRGSSSRQEKEWVALDAPRFAELGTQVYRLICVASLMLASPACGSDQTAAAAHKQALKEKILILIDNTSNDIELKQVLPSLAEEIIQVTEQLLENLNQSPLTGETKEIIRTQILSLGDPEHRVREIVRQRVLEFLKTILVCGGGSRQIPVGLSALARELTSVSGTLLRYVMHNKAVFTSHYMDIVSEELSRN
ncbi:unnamed protein product [Spodoptera littoralis]|uniref:T-complex protein 11-like protein 1 n=1 Tax=Spodoptera littoralis TaxID=7109 RepID=A0A9P0HUI7_SPOLI|nr:unnamed protein product [Spodoptera littoralis]CAH1634762.1 unnamed protein product [Spodoptera littoralis]